MFYKYVQKKLNSSNYLCGTGDGSTERSVLITHDPAKGNIVQIILQFRSSFFFFCEKNVEQSEVGGHSHTNDLRNCLVRYCGQPRLFNRLLVQITKTALAIWEATNQSNTQADSAHL